MIPSFLRCNMALDRSLPIMCGILLLLLPLLPLLIVMIRGV